ncbi:INO80 complex subunit D isoform X2 [Procambarus clarkii]|uniref:INO80 complex subunit D isoform X2 n=2 Tax=Procambarus clarkii TaxID=6728 RepID=UPI003742944B
MQFVVSGICRVTSRLEDWCFSVITMMQESARLPPLLSPAWPPPNISSSVGNGRRGAGKRARGTGILNGHHGRPRPNGHPLQQQNPQDIPQPLSPVSPHAIPQASPQQPSSILSQTQIPFRDMPKTQACLKKLSGAVIAPAISTSLVTASKGRERWGGWLGGSLGSHGGRSEVSRQHANSSPLHSSELRSSGFDMTKLYPELSAKLGLTKHNPSDNIHNHKNGITVRENFTSGPLRKLETVTDDSRIKVVSTGQIINNTKGLIAAKLGNGVQTSKSSSVKPSKPKPRCSDRGQRRGNHSRTSGRPDGISSGTVHTSTHGLGPAPSKGPSSSNSIKSTGTINIRSESNSCNTSSILEEQLRGGVNQRQVVAVSQSLTLNQSRISQPTLPRPVAVSASLTLSSTSASPGRSLVMTPTTYLPSVTTHQTRVVTLLPRRLPPPAITGTAAATLPEPLLRVHTLREKYYAYNSDLFPLGVETSEESDGSDTDDLCGSQQGWLDPNDGPYERYQSWVNNTHELSGRQQSWVDPASLSHLSGGSSCQRSIMLSVALASHRRQVTASRVRTEVRSWEVERRCPLTQTLVDAARTHPRLTADACCLYRTSRTNQESPKIKSRFRSSVLMRRGCVYNDGEGGGECRELSLPGTRHCLRHIMYNVDQQLYTHCTARHPDNTLCRVPVFDVSHELPLCSQHSKTQENNVKTVLEEIPKPKRSRKKNKMPILSRYGKRSKKRRRSSNSMCSVIPSTSVRPPMASQSSLSSPQPSPTTPQTSPHFSTASCTDSVAEAEESELDDDMEGMVEGLDAASRLLDPRDLQDVLNRIPDHELTQLFDAPEGKTGEFENAADDKGEIDTDRGDDDDDHSIGSPIQAHSPPCRTPTVAAATTTTTTTTTTASSTPPLTEEGTTLSLDESTLNELVAGNIPIDSIISSSFNQQELNTISQALSNIVQENNINLAGFDLSAGNSFSASEAGGSGPVGDVSDNSLMSQASDGVGQADFSESGRPVSDCKVNLLSHCPGIIGDTATLSPLK